MGCRVGPVNDILSMATKNLCLNMHASASLRKRIYRRANEGQDREVEMYKSVTGNRDNLPLTGNLRLWLFVAP